MTPEENCDRFRKYCKEQSLNEKNDEDLQIMRAFAVVWASTKGN